MHRTRRFVTVIATAVLAAGSVVAFTAGSAGAGAPCAPAFPDPDGRMRLVGGTLVGKYFYSADGTGQTISVALTPGGPRAKFELFYRNGRDYGASINVAQFGVGGVPDSFVVRYRRGARQNDVTESIVAGTRDFVAPGKGFTAPLTVLVRMRSSAQTDDTLALLVRGKYNSPPGPCGDTLRIEANTGV
jgi:hypothetical protein